MSSWRNCCAGRLCRLQKSAGVRAANGLFIGSRTGNPTRRSAEAPIAAAGTRTRKSPVTFAVCSSANGSGRQSIRKTATGASPAPAVSMPARPRRARSHRRPGRGSASSFRRTTPARFGKFATNAPQPGRYPRSAPTSRSNTLTAMATATSPATNRPNGRAAGTSQGVDSIRTTDASRTSRRARRSSSSAGYEPAAIPKASAAAIVTSRSITARPGGQASTPVDTNAHFAVGGVRMTRRFPRNGRPDFGLTLSGSNVQLRRESTATRRSDMIRLGLATMMVGLLIGGGAARGDEDRSKLVEEELARFQGTWQLISAQTDGVKAPPEQVAKIRVVTAGSRHTVHLGEQAVTPSRCSGG